MSKKINYKLTSLIFMLIFSISILLPWILFLSIPNLRNLLNLTSWFPYIILIWGAFFMSISLSYYIYARKFYDVKFIPLISILIISFLFGLFPYIMFIMSALAHGNGDSTTANWIIFLLIALIIFIISLFCWTFFLIFLNWSTIDKNDRFAKYDELQIRYILSFIFRGWKIVYKNNNYYLKTKRTEYLLVYITIEDVEKVDISFEYKRLVPEHKIDRSSEIFLEEMNEEKIYDIVPPSEFVSELIKISKDENTMLVFENEVPEYDGEEPDSWLLVEQSDFVKEVKDYDKAFKRQT